MSKTTNALILTLLAASWVCLGCRPIRYQATFLNEHDQPAVVEITTGEEDALEHARLVLVVGPGQRSGLWFNDDDRIHSLTARDLQGRPLRIGGGGRVMGLEASYGAEVWQGLGRLRIGLSEAEVREILPSLPPLEPGEEEGEAFAELGCLRVTFVGEGLGSWCLYNLPQTER